MALYLWSPPDQRSVATPASSTPRAANQVTLRAAPGNTEVTMFEVVGEGSNDVTNFFRNGTVCTKLGNPNQVSIQGINMSFYKLTCNGTTGYVNAKWVND